MYYVRVMKSENVIHRLIKIPATWRGIFISVLVYFRLARVRIS